MDNNDRAWIINKDDRINILWVEKTKMKIRKFHGANGVHITDIITQLFKRFCWKSTELFRQSDNDYLISRNEAHSRTRSVCIDYGVQHFFNIFLMLPGVMSFYVTVGIPTKTHTHTHGACNCGRNRKPHENEDDERERKKKKLFKQIFWELKCYSKGENECNAPSLKVICMCIICTSKNAWKPSRKMHNVTHWIRLGTFFFFCFFFFFFNFSWWCSS